MQQQATFGRRGLRPPTPVSQRRPAAVEAPSAEPVEVAERSFSGELLAALPLATAALALVLAIIFQIQRHYAFDIAPSGGLSVDSLIAEGADSANLTLWGGEIWRLALAPLLHASGVHLVGNLVALVLVGALLEPRLGRGWFLAIYVASGLGGEFMSIACNPAWLSGVGASGAISGLLAAAFVMSFSTDDADAGRRMRRRALFFGVPALAPLVWGAHDHTNYFAHLGGALTGAAIAFALDQTWDRVAFRPHFHMQAGLAAAAMLALAAPAAALASVRYDERQAAAAHFIPARELAVSPKVLAEHAADLQRRYPDDPMSRIALALADFQHGRIGEGEGALRATATMPLPSRPWAERSLHTTARGLLAIVLKAERRTNEAREAAAAACQDSGNPSLLNTLQKMGLCTAI